MIKTGLLYSKTHEWVEMIDATTAKMGLTDFAQESLGDIVFVNLPELGTKVEVGVSLGDIESVKAVSDIFSPLSGEIGKINEDLLSSPELINQDAYATWIVEISNISNKEALMSDTEYEAFCLEVA